MTGIDAMGFLAAGLVLCSGCMKRLVPLRVMAIASNLAFILYGYIVSLWPVLILHLILLPVNTVRLAEALGADFPCAFSAAGRQHHLFKNLRIRLLVRRDNLSRNNNATGAIRTD